MELQILLTYFDKIATGSLLSPECT